MTPTRLCITALLAALAGPGLANAQTCASNGDCALGLTCQANTATVTPTCAAGTTCSTPPPPTLSMICLPALCQTDVDCGQAMVCHSTTTTACSGGSTVAVKCDPNSVCPTTPPLPPPVCTDTTISQCAFRWQLPCNTDQDCGDGFACQPTTTGMCSGSASSGSGSTSSSSGTGSGTGALSTPAPLPASDGGATTTCTTTMSFPGSCQAKAATCTTDADCPSIWKCAEANAATVVSSGPIAIDAGASPSPSLPPTTVVATATATATATTTAAKTCQPPNAYPGRPDGTGTSQTPLSYNGSPDGGATTKGTPPATVQPSGGTSTDSKTSATLTRGGCALGGPVAPSSSTARFFLLGLLGAVCLLRLRRSH